MMTAVFLFIAACSSPESPPPGECSDATDCPSAQVCMSGLCGVRDVEPREIGFQIVPPETTSFPQQTVPVTSLDLTTPVTIGLEAGVQVAGRIAFVESANVGPAGTLTFRRRSDGFQNQVRQDDGAYATFVPAGRYDVTFIADDPAIPQRVWLDVAFDLDSDPKFTIPQATDYVVVTGSVSRRDARTNDALNVGGARVYAVSRDTKGLSTIAVTDEDGFFEISVLPDSGDYDIRIAADDDNALVPKVGLDDAFSVRGNDWVSTKTPESPILSVTLGTYELPNDRVEIRVDAPEVSDWTGYSASIVADLGMGAVTLRYDLVDGRFETPGFDTAQLTITTPEDSPFDTFEQAVSKDNNLPIQLPMRDQWEAVVVDMNANSVEARIELRALDQLRSAATTTPDGEVDVWVPEGITSIRIVPTQTTLPTFEFAVGDRLPSQVEIPQPSIVSGTVFGAPEAADRESWRPVDAVSVRAFERRDDERVVLGEGFTNADGEFRIVIPAR